MNVLDVLVEQRIADAAERGEFDNLPGAGMPLDLEDELLVPEEVRVANRVLKNSGFAPTAVEHMRTRRELQQELANTHDEAIQRRLRARLLALDMALESLRGSPMVVPPEYRRQVAEQLYENAVDEQNKAEGLPWTKL